MFPYDLTARWPVIWPVLAEAVSASPPDTAFHVLPEHAWKVGLAYAVLVAVGLIVNVVLIFRFLGRPVQWRERVQRLEQRPWAPFEALRLLIFLVLLYFMVSLAQHVMDRGAADPGVFWIVLQSAMFHVAGIAYVVASLGRQHLSWKEAFGLSAARVRGDFTTGLVVYLAMLPVLWFYSALYQIGLRSLGYDPLPQEVVQLFASESSLWVRAYMVLLAAVVAPFFEEVLFRGIALPVLARRRGMAWAVFVMGIVFAAVHFHLPSMVPLFIVAVTLSIGYIYSGSLLVPIVVHGLFNTVNLILLALLQPAA